jgi:hypothetical protein
MTVSQIIFAIIALIGTSFLMVVMYAVWQGLMEDTARLAIKVRNHTKR